MPSRLTDGRPLRGAAKTASEKVYEDGLEKRSLALGLCGRVHPAFIANQLIEGNALLTPSAYNRLLEARCEIL
jgi:hypothetical protein